MNCPHCGVAFHSNPGFDILGEDSDGMWATSRETCPECKRLVVKLIRGEFAQSQMGRIQLSRIDHEVMVRPKGMFRKPVPREVTEDLAADYREAALVLGDSPKASAALSRRCLQHILREKAGVKRNNLENEIQQVLDAKQVPSFLADSLDAVRQIGNFAAHPIKSQSSGEIVEVEAGEAEWNLDVIEALFDFYFVQPHQIKKRKEALNKKLVDAGKPELK